MIWAKRFAAAVGLLIGAVVLFLLAGGLLSPQIVIDIRSTVPASPEQLQPLMTSHPGRVTWWAEANERMGEDYEVQHLDGPASGAGLRRAAASP